MHTYDLTIPQRNILNLHRLYEDSAISNQCGAVLFGDKIEHSVISDAIKCLINEYDIFNLRIMNIGGDVKQYFTDVPCYPITVETVSSQEEMEHLANRIASTPIPIYDSPLYSFSIVDLPHSTCVIAMLNHLIADAWTFSILINRLNDILSGSQTVPNSYSYIDYVLANNAYISSQRYSKDREFWSDIFDSAPEHTHIRSGDYSNSPDAYRLSVRRESRAQDKFDRFCAQYNLSSAIVYETALIIYLCGINPDNHSVTIGIPVLNRRSVADKKTAGMYVSTVPLRVEIDRSGDVLSLLAEVSETQGKVFRHQAYPYSDILSDVRKRFSYEGNLYDVLFSYQNAKNSSDTETRWYFSGFSATPLTVSIDNRDSDSSDSITIDYQSGIFNDEEEVRLLVKRLECIIDQMIDDPGIRINDIEVLSAEEKGLIISRFNRTAIDYSDLKCIHELFREQARNTPDKSALVYLDKEYSYSFLDEQSDLLATILRAKGIGRNDIVPIVSVRNPYVVVGMIAVLKAGGGFFVIDGSYPKDRIAYLVNECNAKVVLSSGCYDEDWTDVENMLLECKVAEEFKSINDISDSACAIHTSGSTGVPKVTVLSHLGIVNHIRYDLQMLNKVENIISSTIVSFDAFIQEILLGLICNKTVLLMSDEEIYNAEKFSSMLVKHKHSFLFSTPTKIKEYIRLNGDKHILKNVDCLVIGGEAFKSELYGMLRLQNQDCIIVNGYGPAECTFSVTVNDSIDYNRDISIGRPISNTQIYILDDDMKTVPIGIMGEIYVGGYGVGKGYLNQPELTEQRYVTNPFLDAEKGYSGKLYRTGDLARWRSNGEIEYLGRKDNQIKIRGLRVELGEIENVMNTYWGIKLSAICVNRDENTDRQYLMAYYTSEDEIDEKSLRRYLSEKLAKYMVPHYFIHIDNMPMTPSGKIDHKCLPKPKLDDAKHHEYIPPVTETESKLCKVLESLLSRDMVGIEEDFFDDLGGDSLSAMSYVAKAHEVGIDFSLQNVFDHPTIKELADYLALNADHRVIYDRSEFDKYAELLQHNQSDSAKVYQKHSLGSILLTGATGFLGAHILDSVLKQEKGDVYCLIRGADEDICRRRLESTLVYYFGDSYISEIGNRIHIVVGDITADGLSADLPNDIQTVIHAAASVKHFGAYEEFHRINTEGTGHVVDVARRLKARLIHISTISVSGNSMTDDISSFHSDEDLFFKETDLYIGQPLDNVYIRSKFEAERQVLDAMLEGLDAHIIRVGNLTNRESDLLFQPNYNSNAFLNRVKAFLELGVIPDYLMPMYVEFSPVDMTALGIVKLAEYVDKENVLHLYSDKPLYFSKMIPMLKEYGISIITVDPSGFSRKLEETIHDPQRRYIYEAIQNDLDKDGHLLYDVSIHVKNEFTTLLLKQIGFEWKEPDDRYLRRYIDYFRGLEYFNV